MGMALPIFEQRAFRVRTDSGGVNDTPTWAATQDTNVSFDVDTPFRIRFGFIETNGANGNNSPWELQYNLNGGGWVNVTPSSSVVQGSTSASSSADETALTVEHLGTPTSFFNEGAYGDDGSATHRLTSSAHTENEFGIVIIGNDVSNDDQIQFRVVYSDVNDGLIFTQVPTITVIAESDDDREGSGSATIPLQSLDGSGESVAPTYDGSGSSTIPLQTISGQGDIVAPVFEGSGAASIPMQTASGEGEVSVTYEGNGDATIPLQALDGTGTAEDPSIEGSGTAEVPLQIASGDATFDAPIAGDGSATIPFQSIEGTATYDPTEHAVFFYPVSTVDVNDWTTETGGTNLHASIGEEKEESTYIQSSTHGSTCRLKLSEPDGNVHHPTFVEYRITKLDGEEEVVNIIVRLFENETELESWTHNDVNNGWQTIQHEISEATYNSITNFSDLYIEFTSQFGT